MGHNSRTYSIRCRVTPDGCSVAITTEWYEDARYWTKRVEVLQMKYGSHQDVAELLSSATTQVAEMIAQTAPVGRSEARA